MSAHLHPGADPLETTLGWWRYVLNRWWWRNFDHGAGMIYLKLRQEGRVVNHKRVDRLYAEARLQLKRRRRKKEHVEGDCPAVEVASGPLPQVHT